MSKVLQDLFAVTVAKIARLVDKTDPDAWVMPWTKLGLGRHINASTLSAYTGGNQFILAIYSVVQELEGRHWATHKQWQGLGFQVVPNSELPTDPNGDPIKDGRTTLVRWLFPTTCEAHGDKWKKCCSKATQRAPRPKLFTVFHQSQVRPVTDEAMMPTDEIPEATFTPNEIINHWKVAGMKVVMVDSDRAFFNGGQDYINMPPEGAFDSEARYNGTFFHEAVHWMGGEARMGRESQAKSFGDKAYAGEELIAEIGAALIAAALGIEPEPHPEHAHYLRSWLEALQEKPDRLYKAAQVAEKRVERLLALGQLGEMAA